MNWVKYVQKNGKHPNKKELDYILNNTNIGMRIWMAPLIITIAADLVLFIFLLRFFSIIKLIIILIANLMALVAILKLYYKTPRKSELTKDNIYLLKVNYYEKTLKENGSNFIPRYKIRVNDTDLLKEIAYIYGDEITNVNTVYEIHSKYNKPSTKESINVRYLNMKDEEKNLEIDNLKQYKNQSDGEDIYYYALIIKNTIKKDNGINIKEL